MIKLKEEKEIAIMREAGKRLAEVMDKVKGKAEPGMTTEELNSYGERLINQKGGKPSFKGYKGFPAALCTSLNETVVHGVPSKTKLKKGDLLSLDAGFLYEGYHADMAVTLEIKTNENRELIKTTRRALSQGIESIKKAERLGDIGAAIQTTIEEDGFQVVEGLCGHGIGTEVHEDPQVLNTGKKGSGIELQDGMVICLEPMVTTDSPRVQRDGQSFKTEGLSAHFEHTVAIVEGQPKVLTKIN